MFKIILFVAFAATAGSAYSRSNLSRRGYGSVMVLLMDRRSGLSLGSSLLANSSITSTKS